MTSFAHASAGIAVAAAVQHYIFKEEISPSTIFIGVFLGLLPDVDSFFAILIGKWSLGSEKLPHHQFFTHTPFFYLIVSSLIWFFVDRQWALMFCSITLVHLVMDSWSTDDGIMWLWPFLKGQYSLFPMDLHAGGIYGFEFYNRYIRTPRLIFPEIIILVAGMIVVIRLLFPRY